MIFRRLLNKNMKNIKKAILYYIVLFCLFVVSACSKEKIEITENENYYVGEWVLKDISYTVTKTYLVENRFETITCGLKYPSNDASAPMDLQTRFNNVGKQYWEHTKLIFTDRKTERGIEGELIVAEKICNFTWTVDFAPALIDCQGLKFDFILGETLFEQKEVPQIIRKTTDGVVRLLVSAYQTGNGMSYIFEKKA